MKKTLLALVIAGTGLVSSACSYTPKQHMTILTREQYQNMMVEDGVFYDDFGIVQTNTNNSLITRKEIKY